MPNQALTEKNSRSLFACHHSLMAPCKVTQCYDQATVAFDFYIPSVLSGYPEYIAIQSVQNKNLVNTEFDASRKRTFMAMC